MAGLRPQPFLELVRRFGIPPSLSHSRQREQGSSANAKPHRPSGRAGVIPLDRDGRQSIMPPSSFLPPRTTITRASPGTGRCSMSASAAGPVVQQSISSCGTRIAGSALGWNDPTSAFGSVVEKQYQR